MTPKPYLLDVNVLVALAWPNHVHHREALAWFSGTGANAFRTCPITQSGFVRISSNPKFTSEAVSPATALELLAQICRLPGHEFWPDDLPLHDAAGGRILTGHRQVTDFYLLRLAAAHEGAMATLDRGAAILGKGAGLDCALIG